MEAIEVQDSDDNSEYEEKELVAYPYSPDDVSFVPTAPIASPIHLSDHIVSLHHSSSSANAILSRINDIHSTWLNLVLAEAALMPGVDTDLLYRINKDEWLQSAFLFEEYGDVLLAYHETQQQEHIDIDLLQKGINVQQRYQQEAKGKRELRALQGNLVLYAMEAKPFGHWTLWIQTQGGVIARAELIAVTASELTPQDRILIERRNPNHVIRWHRRYIIPRLEVNVAKPSAKRALKWTRIEHLITWRQFCIAMMLGNTSSNRCIPYA